jgi:hypothetical protein
MKVETSVVALFLLTAGLFCSDTAADTSNADLRRRKKINTRKQRKDLLRGVQFSESVSNSVSVSSGDSPDDSRPSKKAPT